MLRSHPSLLLLGAVVGGIIIADLASPSLGSLLIIAGLAVAAGLFLFVRHCAASSALVFAIAFGALAAAHYAHAVYQLPPSHYSRLTSPHQAYQIYGQVADWPDLKTDRTELIISLDSLGQGIAPHISGRLLLKIDDTTTALQRGDRVEFFGRIYPLERGSTNNQFDYTRYLNLRGIFGTVYLPGVLDIRVNRRAQFGWLSGVDYLRDEIRRSLYANLTPSAAALASGFLIGETRDIPVELYRRFRDSGTLHLMAVSGSNVAIVVGCFLIALAPFNLRQTTRAGILILVVLLFAALSYGEPSVLRASVMAILVILAGLTGRRFDLNNIIALAMLLILLVDPAELFDVGFQLSFVTAWGLIFIVPRVTDLFRRHHNSRWYRWLVFPIIISAVAQISSTPLIAYHFGRIPLIGFGANLVIVPLASLALVGILVMLLASLIFPVAGLLVGRLLDLLLLVLEHSVNFLGSSQMPSLQFETSAGSIHASGLVLLVYLILFLLALALSIKAARRWLVALLLFSVNGALLMAAFGRSSQNVETLQVTTVPGGVAALYQPVTGDPDLIITGLADKPYRLEEKVLLPWLRAQKATSLRYLFVLSSKYQALDDLLRLIDSCNVSRAYFSQDCEVSLRQVMHDQPTDPSPGDKLRFFGGTYAENPVGYLLSRETVMLNHPNCRVTCVQSAKNLPPPSTLNHRQPALLIIGQTWKTDPHRWIGLHDSVFDEIICSRIVQAKFQNETDPHQSDNYDLPAYVHQLSRLKEMQIAFSAPIRISSR